MARGQKLLLPGSLLPVKNTFIPEAETINAGTRDIAQVGKHTEKQFVKTEARQRRTPGAKRVQAPPSEEEPHKDAVKSFIYLSSSPSLTSFRPIIWFFSPPLTYPGTLPLVPTHPPVNKDLKVKASGRSNPLYPLTFDPPTRSLSGNV